MNRIPIQIIKVTSPSNFLAKELQNVPGQELSSQAIEFARLSHDINEHFSSEQYFVAPYSSHPQDICLARHPTSKNWMRVRIEEIIHKSNGPHANCFFLDTGESKMVAIRWLRHASREFLKLPFQVKQFCLYGIKPLTLGFNEDMKVAETPTEKWDAAAITYMNRVIRDGHASVVVIEEDEDLVYANLFLHSSARNFCVNDELIHLKYAEKHIIEPGYTGGSFSDGAHPIYKMRNKKKTIKDYLDNCKAKKEKRQHSEFSDSCSSSDSEQRMMEVGSPESILNSTNGDTSKPHIHSRPLHAEVTSHISRRQPGLISEGDAELICAPIDYRVQRTNPSKTELDEDTLLNLSTGRPTTIFSQSDTEVISGIYSTGKYTVGQGQLDCKSLAQSDTEGRNMRGTDPIGHNIKPVSFGRGVLGIHSALQGLPVEAKSSTQTSSENTERRINTTASTYPLSQQTPVAAKKSLDDSMNLNSLMNLLKVTKSPSLLAQSYPYDDNQFINQFDDATNLTSSLPVETRLQASEKIIEDPPRTSQMSTHMKPEYRSSSQKSSTEQETMKRVLLGLGPTCKPRASLNTSLTKHSTSGSDGSEADTLLKKQPSTWTNRRQLSDPRTVEVDDLKAKVIGRIQGKKLLSEIQPKKKTFFSKRETSLPSSHCLRDIKDRVLIHSSLTIIPCYRLEDCPFEESIKQVLEDGFAVKMELIHAYAWPSISRGSHFVGISSQDPKSSMSTKKRMLVYLPSLLSQLSHEKNYSTLPGGKLPLAIIIVSSSSQAQQVNDAIHTFSDFMITLTVLSIYGGGAEDSRIISLINGCDILIATPPCLNRMLKQQYTRLSRLCHLVIDDADVVLEDFTQDIKDLMSQYGQLLKDKRSKAAPQQIILSGSQWTKAISEFMDCYLGNNKNIVITSCFEASIYGHVKQVVYMCKRDRRLNELTGITESCQSFANKIIIFTSGCKETLFLQEILSKLSLYVLVAHHDMDTYETEKVSREWSSHHGNDSKIILVCTDGCLTELQITDAEGIIHYDLPDTKTKFGNRLACMRDNYQQHGSQDLKAPVSYIMMNEDCDVQALSILDLLRRTKSEIPPQLMAMLAGMKEGKENDASKSMCYQVKTFGSCRNSNKCEDRHIVLPDVDGPCSDWFPKTGEVQIRVTHVVNTNHLHARLLEHRIPGQPVHDFKETYFHMLFGMAEWFGKASNLKRYTIPSIGDLCAIQDKDIFHRIKIVDLLGLHSPGSGIKSKVFFIDIGRQSTVDASRLLELPDILQKIPAQVINIFVCRIKPIDNDSYWTPKSDFFIYEALNDKILDGRIVLSMNNSLWLDPLVQRHHLTEVNVTLNKLYVRSELIKNGFAVDNPSHLENLYALSEGKIDIPVFGKEDVHMETDVLPNSKDFHEVFISAVDTPGLMFIQRKEGQKRLEELSTKINSYMESHSDKSRSEELKVGAMCVAHFMEDDKWYRAQVLQLLDNGQIEVFYADYGEKRSVDRDKIHDVPSDFLQLPLQAIECELAHVEPCDNGWTDSSGNAIWGLSHCVNEDQKLLVAQVFSKSTSKYAGFHKYIIELFDTSLEVDVNLSQELVWKNLAKPVSPVISNLFPPPPPVGRKIYHSSAEKIVDLCASVYWCKDETRSLMLAQEISQIFLSLSGRNYLEILGHDGVVSLVNLVGHVGSDDVNNVIIKCIQDASLQNEKLSQEFLAAGTSLCLRQCLEQSNNCAVQLQAAQTIEALARSPTSSWLKAFEDGNIIQVFVDILDAVQNTELQFASCKALAAVCSNSCRCCEIACDNKICDILQRVLCVSENVDLVTEALYLMDTLFSHSSNHSGFQKESLMQAVVERLRVSADRNLICAGVIFSYSFAQRSRKNKTKLLELGLVTILKKLQALFLPACHNIILGLLNSLVVIVPKEYNIKNKPTSPPKTAVNAEGHMPEVRWSQNTFRIILTIRVEGVSQDSDPVYIEETSITFNAAVRGVRYNFTYDIFDKIQPTHSHVAVKTHEVLISLRKVEKGKWPRLLFQKQKLPNIIVDYERYVDSSSDSEVDEEEHPFLLKRCKQRKHLSAMTNNKKKDQPLQFQCVSDSSDSLLGSAEENDPFEILS